MVTRTFVRVRTTPSEAAASSTAVVDSSISAPAPGKQILKQSQLHSCKHRSCTERAKHPGDATAAAEEGLCDRHSTHVNKAEGGDKKRALPSEDSISSEEIKRRKRNCHQKSVVIDLSDVPPQQPIPKSKGRIKEGVSKYTGVYFRKETNQWHAQITVEGKQCQIGSYDNEEEAAVDYARALFKHKGQGALEKAMKLNSFVVDLTGVPPKSPIPKSAGRIKEGMKEGASKYAGVYFKKEIKKWEARILVDGKRRSIGYYESEEDAAVDYARAIFKYKGGAHQQSLLVDLTGVPPQSPIPKSAGRIKEGASKYTGVTFHKQMNKWMAQIRINGKTLCIGFYENEEEAAVDYARALFKQKGQDALDKNTFIVDLADVPTQLPIPKSSAGRNKDGSSKYTGVYSDKQLNKWRAQIRIDGKDQFIGFYENEEEAAVDYARAVFKYKDKGGQKAICADSENINDNEKYQPRGTDEHVFEKKRQSGDALVSDMKTDVSPQPPIPEKWRFFQ
eukprot:scaffold3999_cov138-Skeletonema_dohrnii-CCMP3373.AAC.8